MKNSLLIIFISFSFMQNLNSFSSPTTKEVKIGETIMIKSVNSQINNLNDSFEFVWKIISYPDLENCEFEFVKENNGVIFTPFCKGEYDIKLSVENVYGINVYEEDFLYYVVEPDIVSSELLENQYNSITKNIPMNDWTIEAKNIYYQTEKISPEQALFYQFSMPIPFVNLGYAYSDNWRDGLKWDGIILGIIGTAFLDLKCYEDGDEEEFYHCRENHSDSEWKTFGEINANVFLGAAAAVWIYKNIKVYKLAEKYNDTLYESIFKNSRPYFSLNYSTDNNETMLSFNIPFSKRNN